MVQTIILIIGHITMQPGILHYRYEILLLQILV
nr:MAG TPA: hypothetical protein [Caudoviricetes sp.]